MSEEGRPCGDDVCWCRNGFRPQDLPDRANGDPGRLHMQRKTSVPGPWEWPLFFMGLLMILVMWRLA